MQADPAASSRLVELMQLQDLRALLRAALLVGVGLPLLFVGSGWARRWIGARTTPQRGLLIGNGLFYAGLLVIVAMTMQELGFSLGPLLGAAGVLGIAIGFASQTSVSNVISGLFLMGEQPFVVGDLITVGTTTGRVLSIDMMSVKLVTFDNRFVRIPNEQLIKSEVTTVTRFPVRRLDLELRVAYRSDLARVRAVLMEVAAANPLCLVEPPPLVILQRFGEFSVDVLFAVWATRETWIDLKNTILEQIHTRFEEEGIEIPFPRRTLAHAAGEAPLPVRVVTDETAS